MQSNKKEKTKHKKFRKRAVMSGPKGKRRRAADKEGLADCFNQKGRGEACCYKRNPRTNSGTAKRDGKENERPVVLKGGGEVSPAPSQGGEKFTNYPRHKKRRMRRVRGQKLVSFLRGKDSWTGENNAPFC